MKLYCYSCFFLMHKSHMKPYGKPISPQATKRLRLFSAIMAIKMRTGRSQEEIGWPNLAYEDMQKPTHRTTPYSFLRNNAEFQYAFIQRYVGVLELRCLSHRQGRFNRCLRDKHIAPCRHCGAVCVTSCAPSVLSLILIASKTLADPRRAHAS